jgi:DnaJ-class molecular chaperone
MPTATDFKDYYKTLGVPKTATSEEIKRAYRKIARKCHPDLNPGDKTAEAKFKDLNEANQVLSDPDKREKYDKFGQHWDRPDEAVLGAEIKVPTPDGSVTMKVPKGVKSGQSLKLRGKGWTLPKGGHGDLFAKLQIVMPQQLNEIEQECYEKIQANTTFNPRAHLEEMTL